MFVCVMKKGYKNARPAETKGSGFIGYAICTYNDLVEQFGEPHDRFKDGPWKSFDWKTQVEWAFKLSGEKPTIVTIYDYKSLNHARAVEVWHVGFKGDTDKVSDFFMRHKIPFGR
jgi:hypothetical protein